MASRQHGNVTVAQLHAAGLTAQSIWVRVRRGQLFGEHHLVYSVGRPANTPLERAAAAVLACGQGAALSHESALALWGIKPTWPTSFDVVVLHDRRPRGVCIHRLTGLQPDDFRVQLDIRATSPARTVLDCAPRTDPSRLARLVNDALLSPFLRADQLAETLARFPLHPGVKLVRPYLPGAGDEPTRSEMEDRFLSFCERFGFPRPRINRHVAGNRVDAFFDAERVIVELDSWRYHQSRDAFETDRIRDADALAGGWVTLRMTWPRLNGDPEHEARRLWRILKLRRQAR